MKDKVLAKLTERGQDWQLKDSLLIIESKYPIWVPCFNIAGRPIKDTI